MKKISRSKIRSVFVILRPVLVGALCLMGVIIALFASSEMSGGFGQTVSGHDQIPAGVDKQAALNALIAEVTGVQRFSGADRRTRTQKGDNADDQNAPSTARGKSIAPPQES